MSPVKSSERLGSWKEIAKYLDRDERTVQRWETECNLPVHRTPGRKRGSVFAYPRELDSWLAGQNVGTVSAVAVGSPPLQRRRKAFHAAGWAVMAIVLILLTVNLVKLHRHEPEPAVRLNLIEDKVIGTNQQGRTLWEYRLREPSRWSTDSSNIWRRIEMNGRSTFIVAASHSVSGGGELDCLAADGTLLWRYEPKLTLKFGRQVDNGPWSITGFDFEPDSDPPKLWVAVADSIWGHSFISEIDPESGRSDVKFVNNGAINTIRSVRKRDRSYLLAGGFNNEFDLPALAVLDPRAAYGVSPQTPGTRFYCENCGQGSPLRYFVMPKSELNQLVGQGPNLVHQIDIVGATLHVSTSELSDAMRAIYFFSITPEIRPQSVTLASTYWAEHRRLERQGKVKHSAERCQDYLSPKPIRMWTAESNWSELSVEYIPKGGIPEK